MIQCSLPRAELKLTTKVLRCKMAWIHALHICVPPCWAWIHAHRSERFKWGYLVLGPLQRVSASYLWSDQYIKLIRIALNRQTIRYLISKTKIVKLVRDFPKDSVVADILWGDLFRQGAKSKANLHLTLWGLTLKIAVLPSGWAFFAFFKILYLPKLYYKIHLIYIFIRVV